MEPLSSTDSIVKPPTKGVGGFLSFWGCCNAPYFGFFGVALLPSVFFLKPLEGLFRGLQVKAFIFA